jgi:uncharacterized RDD family membrane protein YckC
MGNESISGAPAGLFRRLAALAYDLLLVTALAFATTFAILPLTHGEALLTSTQGGLAHAYHALITLVVFAYFGASWTRSGQTLGMRAWRIRLETLGGERLRWPGAVVRFTLGAAIAWLGVAGAWYLQEPGSPLAAAGAAAMLLPVIANFAWMRFDAARRTLLDLAGGARVCRVA